jgi:hypothetical protein
MGANTTTSVAYNAASMAAKLISLTFMPPFTGVYLAESGGRPHSPAEEKENYLDT